MFLLDLFRIIKFAWQNFWRNFWLTIVTISIITLALLSVSFLLMFNLITSHVVSTVQAKTEVYIDLTDQAKQAQVEFLVNELNKLPDITEVKYITPDETLTRFKDRYENNDVVLDSLDSLNINPFTGSLLIKVNDINKFPSLLEEISKPEYSNILEINNNEFYQARDLIGAISNYSQKIEKIGFGVSLFFILISIIVVFNTIQMGIYSHREEIGIMKLVGATNIFIRTPFLIEGIFYSLVSVGVIAALLYPILHILQPHVDNFLGEYTLHLVSAVNANFLTVVGLMILVAVVITTFSSILATRRYLKV